MTSCFTGRETTNDAAAPLAIARIIGIQATEA